MLLPVYALFPVNTASFVEPAVTSRINFFEASVSTCVSEEQSTANKQHTTSSCNERRAATWQLLLEEHYDLGSFSDMFPRESRSQIMLGMSLPVNHFLNSFKPIY